MREVIGYRLLIAVHQDSRTMCERGLERNKKGTSPVASGGSLASRVDLSDPHVVSEAHPSDLMLCLKHTLVTLMLCLKHTSVTLMLCLKHT